MKGILLLTGILTITGLYIQTTRIRGKLTQSDGTIIRGSSTKRGFENRLILTRYTGGSDNGALEGTAIAGAACVAEIRAIMNAASAHGLE